MEDMEVVNTELRRYNPILLQKPKIVVVSKVDLPEVKIRLKVLKVKFASAGITPCFISPETGEGVSRLMAEVVKVLGMAVPRAGDAIFKKVFHPKPKRKVSVKNVNGIFVVEALQLERMIVREDLGGVNEQLRRLLLRLGVAEVLKKAGIKAGDRVRCGKLEFTW
jgi:GTP-binding protein